MHTKEEKLAAFGRLLDVMDELREKCPWDRKQTFESLRPNTIEETFELCDALINKDEANICKELGDVLLHVVFYAKIGSEDGSFDIADVCNKLCDKLIFRHPHVYGDAVAKSAGDVVLAWEKIKQKEKDGNKTVLSGVPDALPSLIKAYRVQDKARNVGFDWDKKEDVWPKVAEEISEFHEELAKSGLSFEDLPKDRLFSFDRYPEAARKAKESAKKLSSALNTLIIGGIRGVISMAFIQQKVLTFLLINFLRKEDRLIFVNEVTKFKKIIMFFMQFISYKLFLYIIL